MLFDDRTVAQRRRGFADALVFSERPLSSGEFFAVDVELKEPDWNGHMRFGLTTFVPSERCELPKYSLPDLSKSHPSWIFSLSKMFRYEPMLDDCPEDMSELPMSALKPRRYCKFVTDEGSRVAIMYLNTGANAKMFFIANGAEVKICSEHINAKDPLYGVVDVYGKTRQIRLVEINQVRSLLETSCDAILNHFREDTSNLKSFLDSVCLPVHLKTYLMPH